MNAEEMLTKARTLVLLDHAFWGIMAMRLKFQPNEKIHTAYTDGEFIAYNSEFIKSMPQAEIQFVVAHETGHNVCGHAWRKGDRNNRLWNIACDYVLNGMLQQSNFTVPEWVYLDVRFDGKSEEEVYSILYAENPPKGKSKDGKDKGDGSNKGGDSSGDGNEDSDSNPESEDPGGCGTFKESPKGKEFNNELQGEWKAAAADAAERCRGNVPADLRRMLNDLLNPTLPWYVLLRDFVEKIAKNDYNWMRTNRRHLPMGVIMPSMISEEIPEMAMAIDSSGSITQEMFDLFAPEASGVLQAYDTLLRVFSCDTAIHTEQEYRRCDLPLKLEIKGGGNTDFRPVFNRIKEQGYSPACLVYLTDLEGRFPEQEPEYPVLWISTNKKLTAPFGTTIYF
jgi:predicted metal-dependent peptidase